MKRMWSRNQLTLMALSMAIQAMQSGNVENVKVFENIVDKDGHKRFIESDGVPYESITSAYCKSSLSGTHLMLVLAGVVPANTTIPSSTALAQFNLPKWIRDKIYPVQSNLIEYKEVVTINSEFNTKTMNVYMDKNSQGLVVVANGEFTTTTDRGFRIQFDLLIDNA